MSLLPRAARMQRVSAPFEVAEWRHPVHLFSSAALSPRVPVASRASNWLRGSSDHMAPTGSSWGTQGTNSPASRCCLCPSVCSSSFRVGSDDGASKLRASCPPGNSWSPSRRSRRRHRLQASPSDDSVKCVRFFCMHVDVYLILHVHQGIRRQILVLD